MDSIYRHSRANGMRLFSFIIRGRRRKNRLRRILEHGIQMVSGVALAACTWKSNCHPTWTLGFSALAVEGATHLCINMRKYIRKLTYLQRERIRSTALLVTGAVTYFANVVAFSKTLKKNGKLWIPYLMAAATGYYLCILSNKRFGRTVLNRTPIFKCCQLLFGPALFGSAAYYLLSVRQHEEEWLRCLPLVASAAVATHISFTGYRRVESNNEPRWLLFKGLELLVGGCIVCISDAVLVVYSMHNDFHPFLILFFTTMVFSGATDIAYSLESFQGCVEIEAPIFYCISSMIGGPIIFLSAFLGVALVDHPFMLPVFIIMAGAGLFMLGKSVLDLYELVPRPVFNKYCQRVLGPVVTVYSTLVLVYTGCSMGWRFSLVMIPQISIGIYATYRGWK